MMRSLNSKTYLLFFILLGWYSSLSFADVYGIPFIVGDQAVCDTGINMYSVRNVCAWEDRYEPSGVGLFPIGKINTESDGLARWGFADVYVPFTGDYFLRMRYCHAESAGTCNIKDTSEYFDTGVKRLTSDRTILAQHPSFPPGRGGMLSTRSTGCFTLVSTDGTEWATSGIGSSCQDATYLPTTPAFCHLNMGADLDVDMGTVERGMIATVPGSTTKKDIPIKVMCTSDATLTATYSFSYTPITIMGSEVVSTSTTGLGIALYLDDEMMSTNSSVSKDYGPGISTVNLGFELVRDPQADIGTISTGDYHADIILVLTKQ